MATEQLLQAILSRLGAIEKKLGVASSSSDDADARSPLAVDFEASIINGPVKALLEAAASIPGEDGPKIVRGAPPPPPRRPPPFSCPAKCRLTAPPPPPPLPRPLSPGRPRRCPRSSPSRSRCWT